MGLLDADAELPAWLRPPIQPPMTPQAQATSDWLAPDPNATYGTILPFAVDNATGKGRLAMPSIVRDLVRGATNIGIGASGEGPVPTNAAATVLALGPTAAAVAAPPAGATFGVFGGPGARTANKEALARAQKLARRSGADQTEIYRDTGWFKGADGRWRFEIPDSEAKLGDTNDFWMKYVLDHPALYEAYPKLQETQVKRRPIGELFGARGMVNQGQITLDSQLVKQADPELFSVLMHEAQHVLQGKERFAPGGAPSDALAMRLPENWRTEDQQVYYLAKLLRDWNRPSPGGKDRSGVAERMFADEFSRVTPEQVAEARRLAANNVFTDKELRNAANDARYEAYRRLMGEVEARNVQARLPMTRADRLYRPPWATQDVPNELQIKINRGRQSGLLGEP